MLIHPWDEMPLSEVSDFLATHDFGQLVTAPDASGWPVVVPTHFVMSGSSVLLHLARPNPALRVIASARSVVLTVLGDYAFVPSGWRLLPDQDAASGVPTSYYSAVQLRCHATLVTDPSEKAALLTEQLAHFQPSGDHGLVSASDGPYARMLSGITGLRLEVVEVRAKAKYDAHKPESFRSAVAEHLLERDAPGDRAAYARVAGSAPVGVGPAAADRGL